MICVYPADCKDFSNNGLGIVLPQQEKQEKSALKIKQ